MNETEVRADDRCPECGTPMEVAEVAERDEVGPIELVLRCGNGHTLRVRREESGEEGGDDL